MSTTAKKSTSKSKESTVKKPFSIIVTGDKSSNAKGENLSIEELTELLRAGISSKAKRKSLISFLKIMSESDDNIINEMFFGNIIYKTWNYSKFKTIKGNRNVKSNKVDKLAKSIEDGMNLLPFCPVLVDKDFQICDGQHRFETAKTSGLPVYYMVMDEMALEDIAKMNSNSNSWTMNDYLNLYIQLEKEDYVYLDAFVTKNKISVSTGIDLLTETNDRRGNVASEFKSGNFKIDEEQKKFANRVIKMLDDFSEYDSNITKKRNFIRTVITLVKKENNKEDYSHTKMMAKMEDIGKTYFVEQVNQIDYLRMIERIYNYKLSSGKIRLY